MAEELLLHPDTNPNVKTLPEMLTALHLCVSANHFAIARALLENDATACNTASADGETALTMAARWVERTKASQSL